MTQNSNAELELLSDEDLVRKFNNGQREVFETLFNRYYKKIYNLCLRFCNSDRNLAEETAQETFLQAYKSLPRFQYKSSFYTWLYRVTFNTCSINVKKQARLRSSSLENFDIDHTNKSFQEPADLVLKREYSHYVNKALNELPEEQKQVMLLGPVLGHSYQEISEIIGESVTVIKGRLFRARQNFKKKFEKVFQKNNFSKNADTK
ncbi:MAG: RNA polymerase sigma factor [bacterium]|nr:RNA polymerase sigma factor [bacterium]